jgi:hypothetical protein
VKYFYNVKNTILYIQDIEIINAFRDGVSNIKTVEEIIMKKPNTVSDLLTVTDVCIEASEARPQLLETWGKGTSRKKEDRAVNTADRGKQSSEHKKEEAFSAFQGCGEVV